MTTKKREYEKPSVRVIELQHRTKLLVGSDQVDATMSGTWQEETI